MVDVDKITKETIEKGGVLALLYFDLHGTSKETLTNLSAGLVQKILKEEGVVYALGEIDEPMEREQGFSTSVEVKILVRSFNLMGRVCAQYSPLSLEILRPDDIKLSIDQAHELLMNISTTTFEYKKFIIQRTSKKEDVEKYQKELEAKAKLGKKLLEEKEGNK